MLWTEYAARWWGVAVVAAGALAYVLGVPQWRYLVHRWEITETAVYTQRGWWARERRIAPMSRVQTVDYAQGPLARLFGLATLTVTTASAAGALRIDGLDRAAALALVDQLTLRAEEAGGRRDVTLRDASSLGSSGTTALATARPPDAAGPPTDRAAPVRHTPGRRVPLRRRPGWQRRDARASSRSGSRSPSVSCAT